MAPPVTVHGRAAQSCRWPGPAPTATGQAAPLSLPRNHAAVFPRAASYPSTPPCPGSVHPVHVHPPHPAVRTTSRSARAVTGSRTLSTRGPWRTPHADSPPGARFDRRRLVPSLHPPHEPVASSHRQLRLAIRVTRAWSIPRVHAEVSRAAPGTALHYSPPATATGRGDLPIPPGIPLPPRAEQHPLGCCYPQSPPYRPSHRSRNRRLRPGRVDPR